MRAASMLMALVVLAAACAGDDRPPLATPPTPATNAPVADPSPARAVVTPTTAASFALPTPWVRPPDPLRFGVTLIDVDSGETTVLYEGRRYPVILGDETWIYVGEGEPTRLDLDGQPIVSAIPRCRPLSEEGTSVEIEGRSYDAKCGAFSPDGRHMIYSVLDESGLLLDTFVLDVANATSVLVVDDYGLCQCDGAALARPGWSVSGRYFLNPRVGVSRLIDVIGGTARGLPDGEGLVWSPSENAFLLPGPEGGVLVEDAATGARRELVGARWPVYRSEDDALLHWRDGARTVIVDPATGAELARWPGRPSLRPVQRGVRLVDSEPAALLQRAGCGTAVYHPELPAEGRCISGAEGAAWSPQADRVAFTRLLGLFAGRPRWEIVVTGIGDERERVLAVVEPRGEGRTDWAPPLIRWNAAGTHIMVVWPGPDGI